MLGAKGWGNSDIGVFLNVPNPSNFYFAKFLFLGSRFPAVNALYFVMGFSSKASVECKTLIRESPKLIGKIHSHLLKEVPANRDTFF